MEVDKEDRIVAASEIPDGGGCSTEKMLVDTMPLECSDKAESSENKTEELNLSKIEDELLNNSLDLESEIKTFLGVSLESDDSVMEEDLEKKLLFEDDEKEMSQKNTTEENKTVEDQTIGAEKTKDVEQMTAAEVNKDCKDLITDTEDFLKIPVDSTSDAALLKKTTIATASTNIDQTIAEEFDDDETSFSGVNDIVQNILSNKFSNIENKIKEVTASIKQLAEVDSKTSDVDSVTPDIDSVTHDVDSKMSDVDSKTPDGDSMTHDVDSKMPYVDSKTSDVNFKTPDGDSKTSDVDSKTSDVDSKMSAFDSKTPDGDSMTNDVDSKMSNVDSKMLDVDFKKPDGESKTPDGDSKMTDVDFKTSDVDSVTSDVDSKMPDVDSKTPDSDSEMPDVDSKTSDGDSEMLNVDSKMPNVDSKTPDVDSKTPDVDSKTPDVDSKMPDGESKTLNGDSEMLDVDSKTPDVHSKMPDGDSEMLDVDPKTSDVHSKMLNVDSKMPDVDFKMPDVDSKTPDAETKEKASLDKQMNDLEDASLDGLNDGDALGLLAETEGRERHSSDPDDDDDEEPENSDRESVDETSDIDGDDDTDSDTTDDEYQPQFDDEEDDDEIDEEDEDGHIFRATKTPISDIQDESTQENDDLPLAADQEVDEEAADNEAMEEPMDMEDASNEEMMSICNVTSLANSSEIDIEFFQGTDDILEKENDLPGLVITSICSVDKATIDQIASFKVSGSTEKETMEEEQTSQIDSVESMIIETVEPVNQVTNEKIDSFEKETVDEISPSEKETMEESELKTVETELSEDMESIEQETTKEIESVEKEVTEKEMQSIEKETKSAKTETVKESELIEKMTVNEVESVEKESILRRTSFEKEPPEDIESLKNKILENIQEEIVINKEIEKVPTLETEVADEIKDTVNVINNVVDNVCKDDKVEKVVKHVSEVPKDVSELPKNESDTPKDVSDEVQDIWDSLLESELPMDSNKNKRKADESLEKVSKKLDTKKVSDTDVGLSMGVSKEIEIAKDVDEAVFPAVGTLNDIMGQSKNMEVHLPVDILSAIERLETGLDNVLDDDVKPAVVKTEPVTQDEVKDSVAVAVAAAVEKSPSSVSRTSRLEIAKNVTDKMMNIVDLEESSSDTDDNVGPIESCTSTEVPPASLEKEFKKEPVDTEKMTDVLTPPVDHAIIIKKEKEAEVTGDPLSVMEPPDVKTPIEAADSCELQSDVMLVQPAVSEVFNLDSDEDDVASKEAVLTEAPAVPVKPVEKTPPVLDKRMCVNPTCSKWGSSLQPCPLFLPSLYRARDLKTSPLACAECLDRGVKLMEVLTTRLRLGHCLFDVDMPNNGDMVEISDSDSDDEGTQSKMAKHKAGTPLLSSEEVTFLKDNLPDVFSETWHKYQVTNQLTMCENSLRMEMDQLDAKARELGTMIDAEQEDLDRMRKVLYETFRLPTECRKEVTITENGDTQVEINLMVERRSARSKKPVVYDEHAARAESPILTADGVLSDTLVQDAATLKNKADLPPQGMLPEQPLKVGDLIFAVKQSIFGAWCPAKIVQILPKGTPLANGTLSLFSLVRVRFTQLTLGEAARAIKQVTGRQLAYPEPASVRYTIGTRVIALFKNQKQLKSAYYSGVVAEVPLRTNRYRYLVFFDDGYARYVPHPDVLLVCERSARVWEDVHPDSRDFVRKYLQGYPDQPMVRVESGHSIRAEYNGKFWFAHVMAVDSSLVLIKFSESSGAPVTREEWIYRGSTRLEPLFLELQAADRKAQGRHRASYATTNPSKNRNFPYVEYSRPEQGEEGGDVQVVEAMPPPDESESTQPQPETAAGSRSVARKSTARADQVITSEKLDQPPTHQLHADQVKSKVVYYSPKVSIKPAKLAPHTCGPDCLNKDALPLRDLRTYNPLARPLLSGWQRLILKYRGKRTIVYRAPCGRRLRSAQELHLYLRLTSSQMSVDLFDFDHWVHCLAEFVPTKCFVSKRDLSHGVEAVPVPCVNYYDHSLPEFSSYSTRRIPTQGVHLNLDEEFLCGCDCTDDCQDKSRCQCWQLTLEGAQLICSQQDRVGYQYKRLLDPVPTGIYECNSRCKCAATCLNRVVQHPLQLKLQVFKTFNRGWGIRALNDVSRGTFLCIYAGNLLTDAVANVDGVNEGDEYLAELDYIEVAEKLKENYESDVPDEDKEDSKSDSEEDTAQRPLANRDGKTGAHGESDEEFTPGSYVRKGNPEEDSIRMRTRRQLKKKDKEDDSTKKPKAPQKDKEEKKEIPDKFKETLDKIKEDPSEAVKISGTADRHSKDSDGTTSDGVAPVLDEFITISDDEESMREPSRFAAPEGLNDDEYVPRHRSVRSFFGKDEACYIMDAKVQGNLGRYLNHSCSPNVFVQNVFVDTHDPRFPWVAFFTLNHVRAGTELTWNYNYDVGSVPGKALYCGCGASNCRGRLL